MIPREENFLSYPIEPDLLINPGNGGPIRILNRNSKIESNLNRDAD